MPLMGISSAQHQKVQNANSTQPAGRSQATEQHTRKAVRALQMLLCVHPACQLPNSMTAQSYSQLIFARCLQHAERDVLNTMHMRYHTMRMNKYSCKTLTHSAAVLGIVCLQEMHCPSCRTNRGT